MQSSSRDYLCRPLEYSSIVQTDFMMDYQSNRCARFVAPGFLDSTKEDNILISEFSANRLVLCTRSLQMIQEYNHFRTSKNVFVIKNQDAFLCSDWHRVSLTDIEQARITWEVKLLRPLNPWGVCILDGMSADQVAVCLPSTEQVMLFDTRISSDTPIGEWSFKGVKWSDRVLPYAIAPNGMVTIGTSTGYGALMKCDIATGRPLEIVTHLDRPALSCESDSNLAEEMKKPAAPDSLISSTITDIALDCDKTCIVPDAINSRIIFRSNIGDMDVLSEHSMMKSPSGVTLLRDGSLIISDNRANTILTCTL